MAQATRKYGIVLNDQPVVTGAEADITVKFTIDKGDRITAGTQPDITRYGALVQQFNTACVDANINCNRIAFGIIGAKCRNPATRV